MTYSTQQTTTFETDTLTQDACAQWHNDWTNRWNRAKQRYDVLLDEKAVLTEMREALGETVVVAALSTQLLAEVTQVQHDIKVLGDEQAEILAHEAALARANRDVHSNIAKMQGINREQRMRAAPDYRFPD